jgi:hypothetical protein
MNLKRKRIRAIRKMFEDILRDDWMDDHDYQMFWRRFKKYINYKILLNKINEGMKNGYSFEEQINYCKISLKQLIITNEDTECFIKFGAREEPN